jgi:hypothetical protein
MAGVELPLFVVVQLLKNMLVILFEKAFLFVFLERELLFVDRLLLCLTSAD